MRAGKSGEDLIFEIALEGITRAADLFRPIHERTRHIYWGEQGARAPPTLWATLQPSREAASE